MIETFFEVLADHDPDFRRAQAYELGKKGRRVAIIMLALITVTYLILK